METTQEATIRQRQKNNALIETVESNRPEGLISRYQFAAHFRISLKTEYNWRMAGMIPYIKIGPKVLYQISDVIEFQELSRQLQLTT